MLPHITPPVNSVLSKVVREHLPTSNSSSDVPDALRDDVYSMMMRDRAAVMMKSRVFARVKRGRNNNDG
jgi:hypothetical protein